MNRTSQLVAEAATLSESQIEDLIAVAQYFKAETYFASAPTEVRASIDRGIADAEAGRTKPGSEVWFWPACSLYPAFPGHEAIRLHGRGRSSP